MPREFFQDGAALPFAELNERMYGKYSPLYHNWTYNGWSGLADGMPRTAGNFGEFVKSVEFKQEETGGETHDICNVLLVGPKGTVQYKTQHAPLADRYADSFIVLKMGQHSPLPFFEGQQPSKEGCKYLDGLPCYYNECSRQRIDINTSMFCEEGLPEFWQCMFGLYAYFFEYEDPMALFNRYPYELFLVDDFDY